MLQYVVFIGALVQLIGAASYIKSVVQGKAKPNKVTWLMWSVAPLIASAAALSNGVTWAVLPVFMSGFAPLLVLIVSFLNKQSYWKLGTTDYICGALSVLALILWAITKEPNIAIIFAIASDGSAAIPTLIKSWRYPESESVSAYTTGLFNALTSFAAIQIFNFSSLAFPIYLVLINTSLTFSIYRPKSPKKIDATE